MTKVPLQQTADGFYLNRTPWFAFLLLCSIFALWAAAASMNDVLIAQHCRPASAHRGASPGIWPGLDEP